jgi:glutamine amidotransferase
VPLATLVFHGSHSLYRQSWAPRELLSGSVNADGYGIAWSGPDGHPVRLARAEPIWYDADLRRLLSTIEAPVVQATLRNATPGLPVDRSGVLPIVGEGWAFSLNGAVPSFRGRHMRALRTALSAERYASLTGVSDSETLFLGVLQRMDEGRTPLEALRAQVAAVAARLEDGEGAALTLVLSSGTEGAFIVHTAVGESGCNSLYRIESPPWAPGGSVFASEPLDDGSEWTPVPAGSAWTQRLDGTVERGPA